MKKITLLLQAFTFSDGSRVSWTPTKTILLHRRVWEVSVSIPAPVGGFYTQHFTITSQTPSAYRSVKLIDMIRIDRPGLATK